jgi:hypothetical protein
MGRFYRTLILVFVSLVLIFAAARIVLGHEGRKIGPYDVEVGWHSEPAFTGQVNGVELIVLKDKQPVLGVERTLKLEVLFGGKSKVFPLEPDDENPGHYVAVVLPTRPGDFTFHFTGKIGDTVVDEKFTSADGKFSTVEPSSDIAFPEPVDSGTSVADLQRQIDELKAEVEALKATPSR